MSELEDKINSVLNDPGQMEQISKLAQSIMGGGDGGNTDSGGNIDSGMLGKISSLMGSGNSSKQALLNAMKPYLSEKRRTKLERAMKLANLARIARLAFSDTEGRDV